MARAALDGRAIGHFSAWLRAELCTRYLAESTGATAHQSFGEQCVSNGRCALIWRICMQVFVVCGCSSEDWFTQPFSFFFLKKPPMRPPSSTLVRCTCRCTLHVWRVCPRRESVDGMACPSALTAVVKRKCAFFFRLGIATGLALVPGGAWIGAF